MKIQLITITLLLAACGNKGNEATSRPKTNSGQSCEVQVAELSDWMTKLRDEGGHQWPVSDTEEFNMVTLPKGAEPSEHAVVMSLNRESVLVEGNPVVGETVDVDKLVNFLKAVKQQANEHAPSREILGLVVDKTTPWSKVVAAVEAGVQAGFPRVEFLFKNPPATRTLSAPAASSLTKEIAVARKEMGKLMAPADPSERQKPLSDGSGAAKPDLLKIVAAECPALQANIAETANQEPAKRLEHMTDSVVAAVGQCDCKVDIPALKEFYWYFRSQGSNRLYSGLTVTPVAPEASDAVVVTASGDSTWQETHTKIVGLAQTGTLAKIALKVE